ncbi:hypothetical protein F4604DRAFT_1210299 [Suillus subluteus]|nr:hypothetical protein F4604DRAFT_1210299 [Suillus subluteus]
MVIFSRMPCSQRHISRFLGQNGVSDMRTAFRIAQATESVCWAVKWPMLFLDIVPLNLDKDATDDCFYVHIWHFNKRVTARSENTYNSSPPDLLIHKPGRLIGACYNEEIIPNHPYIATVCPFFTRSLDMFFLEQGRLTFAWAGIFGRGYSKLTLATL